MANLDLSKYGITDVKEVLHNPSYDVLFAEETKRRTLWSSSRTSSR